MKFLLLPPAKPAWGKIVNNTTFLNGFGYCSPPPRASRGKSAQMSMLFQVKQLHRLRFRKNLL
ncbi:MAG: hypothetical protein LBR79_01095 [Oscillospiraceae bacterium]|nr:hypothetical protein [Oscillospiraceae bacterium]